MKRRFLRLLSFIAFICAAQSAGAQSGPYGNEWIDYGKTYYKFKVGATGPCRITRAALSAAGVPPGVMGSAFMLFRDGREVPVYVSAEAMAATDYIEFWGRGADGLLDKELYLEPGHQPNDRISLFTDTACYYLTYDAASNHARFVQAANAIPGGTLTAEPSAMATVAVHSKTAFSQGPSYYGKDELVSSEFDNGEGFIGTPFQHTSSTILTQVNLSRATLNGNAAFTGNIVLRSYNPATRTVRLLNNNIPIADSFFARSGTVAFRVTLTPAQYGVVNTFYFRDLAPPPYNVYDNYAVAFGEMEYPRDFVMAGQDFAAMSLPGTGGAQYLEFPGMGGGRIYDLTNSKWYAGNTAVAGKTRFYLDPSFAKRDIVVLPDAGIASIAALTPVKELRFKNYNSSAQQGDFIIISHNRLMQPVGGRNHVQDYAAYRASAPGGAHAVVTADVDELYDQFAYGYDIHPLSIKHFLKFAADKWTTKPADVFLIGHGLLYKRYATYRANPSLYPYPIVPTYGDPGSDVDFVMWGGVLQPKMRIGRLSVWNAAEIGTYLAKIQGYEAILQPAPFPTLATEIWKKRAMHTIGARDAALQVGLEMAMDKAATIIQDSLTGKRVWKFAKSENQAISVLNSVIADSLLRGGTSQISFYGHASPYSLDYNLADPNTYNAAYRLPFFLALGCSAAQMFEPAPAKTVSEKYTLAPNGGSIVFYASDNVSLTGWDDDYLNLIYGSLASRNYGKPLGTHANDLITRGNALSAQKGILHYPNVNSAQLECMIFGGDPSLQVAAPAKPDYHVSAEGLAAVPANVSTALDSFSLRIASFNLAKAIADSVVVKVVHINPANVSKTVATYTVRNLHFSDTTTVQIPVLKTTGLGLNKYVVTVDAANRYDETSEANNTATFELFIYSDNLVPVYPRNFGIVNTQTVMLKASTLNPFRKTGRYKMEMDTSELFSSPLKQSTIITSAGGVIKWAPATQLTDSTVYYWRASFDSTVNGGHQWVYSSFIYLKNGSPGWNQSHYFQYAKDDSMGLHLHPDRLFRYRRYTRKLEVRNKNIGSSGNENADGVDVRNYLDGIRIEQSSYSTRNALQITVVDTNGRFWMNGPTTRYGAAPTTNPHYAREYNLYSPASRNAAARFLDTIPNGWFVVIKSVAWKNWTGTNDAAYWQTDSAISGPGKTLYDVIKRLGFNQIDSLYGERIMVLARKKGIDSYPIFQRVSDSLREVIAVTFDISASDISGDYQSTVIGPAKTWETFKWKTAPFDTSGRNDSAAMAVIGIDANGVERMLVPRLTGDTSLSWINAQQYPNLRLRWHSRDSQNCTSPQLTYWRVLYAPFPEAALNPAIHYAFSDSLAQGQMQTFSTAIENLTELPMDSMLVRYRIIGEDGVARLLADRRYRPLPGNDTLHASITFDPAPYPGRNIFFVEANPANDQPEEYHPNNLGYAPFRIAVDNLNPLLDVTFDNVHILNGDIVSAKPYIKIRLKDENQFLRLTDTGGLKMQLRYPGQSTPVDVSFDGSRCRFVPAAGVGKANEAVVEFRPDLVADGTYQLSVSGADRSGNGAGTEAGAAQRSMYRIEFAVDNKPSITRVLNYPNPFSTATAFLFTLTGSQIPSGLRIQIMSVTGKVVREITRDELGPLHIGRNITTYQWDGRDQYGQLLGNGVYLYRVVTSLNGQDVELRDGTSGDGASNVERFFKGGWGKMYIMR